MSHPLAEAVFNDSTSYAARVANATAMTERHYRAFLLRLINAEATKQRRVFNVKVKPKDIDQAAADLYDYMRAHVDEWQDNKDPDAETIEQFAARGHHVV